MRMRPLTDRAVYILYGLAVVVAVVLLAVVLTSPAEGSEGNVAVSGSDVPGTPAVVGGGLIVAAPHGAGRVAPGEERHSGSFADLIGFQPQYRQPRDVPQRLTHTPRVRELRLQQIGSEHRRLGDMGTADVADAVGVHVLWQADDPINVHSGSFRDLIDDNLEVGLPRNVIHHRRTMLQRQHQLSRLAHERRFVQPSPSRLQPLSRELGAHLGTVSDEGRLVGDHDSIAGHSASFRDLIAATPAEGDPAYYAERHAASWEYTHLLNVACSDGSCWPVLWDHGLIQGDPRLCYYACGGWVAAEDFGAVDNAFRAVLTAWGVPGAAATLPDGNHPGPTDADTAAPRVPVDAVPALTDPVALIHRYFPPDQWAKAERVMWCESNGVPTAKNPRSSASGLFQHLATYWPERSAAAGWAGADIFDPEANVAVAAWLWRTGGWGHWVCK